MRGWTAGSDLFEGEKAQRQMLASAGARLMRPKLAASLAHWRSDYEATVVARRALGAAGVLEVAKERIAQLEARLLESEGRVARWLEAQRHAVVDGRVAQLLEYNPDLRVRVRLKPGRYPLTRPLQLATGLAGRVEHDGPRVEWTADEPGQPPRTWR